jgi:hypothetical protein
MTKEILRFHSPQNCELYSLRGSTLRYVACGCLTDLDTSRVIDCILGPDQFLWSHIAMDQDGFTPDPDTFLFASATIFQVEQIDFLPPQCHDQTQNWKQIWVLREKLAQLFDAIPSLRVVRAEMNSIVPPQGVTQWTAGETYSGCCDESHITYEPQSSRTTSTDQAPNQRNTLDGFRMIVSAPSFNRGTLGHHRLVVGLLVAMLCVVVPWLDRIAAKVPAPPPEPAVFYNRIEIEPILEQILPIVSGMELQNMTIFGGVGTVTLGLGPDRSWPKDQIDALSKLCASRGCQLIGPTPPTAATVTLRGMK